VPNLDINIVAKSKLKSELLVAQQALKQLGQQATAAARDVAKGIGDPARVQQLTRAWEQQNAVVRQLSGEYRKLSGSVDETSKSFRSLVGESRGLRRIAGELTNFGSGISGLTSLLGGLAGGFVGAFAGQAVGNAIDFMLKSLGSMAEALGKLQNQALSSGVPPIVLQAIGEAAKRAGLDAEVGAKSFESFSKALDALRATPDPGIKIVNGMAMVVPEIDKGTAATKDWSNSLEALGIRFRSFPDTPQGKVDAYRAAVEKALALEARFPSQINRLSQELFGAPIAVIRAMADDIDKLNAHIANLANTARGAGSPILQQLGELKTAQGQVSTAFQELTAGYQKWLLAQQTAANQWLASVLQNWPTSFAQVLDRMQTNLSNWVNAAGQLFTSWGDSLDATLTRVADAFVNWAGETLAAALNNATQNFTNWGASIQDVFTQLWTSLTDGFTSFWNSLTQTASAALDGLLQKVTAVVDYIKSAIASVGSAIGGAATAGAPVGPGGFAAGGVVRGRGTGTSDSILARLSNGEFVMRAAAVQHWGAGMLSAMNSAGTPRFADGGLVAAGAGGGVPVHLHLGGREFALAGAVDVVGALVTHARQSQMRSSGVKPSWYGGRPNN